jgi:tripartite-type tricarboxylate transporter receptor subunit TctC
VRDGRLRGLAVTALKRSDDTSNLPTVDESGFKGFEAGSWFALLAPAGTPQPILDKIRNETLKVLADPEMAKKFQALGLQAVGSTPEQTAATIASDLPKWAQVVKDAHIKLGN